jgi:superfamily II DNA or RNA helicase
MAARDYQILWNDDIQNAWDGGAQNVIGVMPTGGGKTFCFGKLIKDKDRPSVLISHRQELVSQAALALNREEIPHGIIAPKSVISEIVKTEIETHGKSYYKFRAPTRVAGVHTLGARGTNDPWFDQVEYAVIDEGHHVLRDNIFGKALLSFKTARGLLPTAHALRPDGCGLGRTADGLADSLVLGPSPRNLINRGFLADYRLIAPPSDIDVSQVPIGSTGDFSAPKLREAVHKSRTIVGDVVREYLRYAPGKRGLTFAVDIEAAKELVAEYRKANVPAEIITADTGISERAKIMRRFRLGSILQLVSVDVLGEGTDVPSVEIVSMARPTHSFQLYAQQFGRALRVSVDDALYLHWDQYSDDQRLAFIALSLKPKAIIIDHVGNWERHGLPDRPRTYSLDRRERRSRRQEGEIPLTRCLNCFEPYEAILIACPHCGSTPAPRSRSSPEHVDGDLQELDAATLAQLRGEVARVNGAPLIPDNASYAIVGSIKKRHRERQQAQQELRTAIALWAGYWKMHGAPDQETYRRFFFAFGKDMMTAQALGAGDANEMTNAIKMEIQRLNIEERK